MKKKRKSFLFKALTAFMAAIALAGSEIGGGVKLLSGIEAAAASESTSSEALTEAISSVSGIASKSEMSPWKKSTAEITKAEKDTEDDSKSADKSEEDSAITYSASGSRLYFPADGEESPYTGRKTVEHLYGYYSLSDREQKIYEQIADAMQNRKKSLAFKYDDKVTYDELARVWYLMLLNDYSFFYVTIDSPDYTTYRDNGCIASLRLHYEYNDANIVEKMRKETEAEAEKILSQMTHDMSDYEIVKLIHDSVITSCSYSNDGNDVRTVYGCLVNKEANCQGYSRTFIYLCHQAGIKALSVHNDTHMWNLVEMDGEYYHIDLVGDDLDMEDFPDFVLYDYFCLTDKQITELSEVTDDGIFEVPAADGTEYYYYSYNDLAAKDVDGAKEIITREIAKAAESEDAGIQFICTDSDAYDKITSALWANNGKTALAAIKKALKQSSEVSNIESFSMASIEEYLTIIILLDYAD